MTSNKLKIVAIITMIIDHFAYYFAGKLNQELYIALRIIGRIAMPIFTFLIVEGYFYTSNLKKYISRLTILAIVTQISLLLIEFIFKDKAFDISATLNIIFSFIVVIIFMKLFDNTIEKKNLSSKLIISIFTVAIIIMYQYISFDYDFVVLILGISFFMIKKYIKNVYLYKLLLAIAIIILSLIMGEIRSFAIVAIPFILLYNNKLGKKSKILKITFYISFPLQHVLLYVISLLLN